MRKWISFVVCTLCFPVVWGLMDYIYALIAGETFQLKVGGNLIAPLIAGAVVGYFTFIRQKDGKK